MKSKTGADLRLELDERVYPLEAAQAAAYAFTDRVYARVEATAAGRLLVTLSVKPGTPPAAREALEGEFWNELLHQALRLKVSEANRTIREYVVTKALVSAQPSGGAPAAPADGCPECEAAAPPAPAPLDAELEKEIDRLLAAIDGGGAEDPLGVAVPWEEKFGSGEGRS